MCEHLLPGPGGTPLVLRLSEGLGLTRHTAKVLVGIEGWTLGMLTGAAKTDC